MDLQLDHNNTSQSEEHVMVLLTMKAGNLSGWNINDWWCVITSVWLALVLTVVVLTLLSVGNLIFKSRKRKSRSGASVPVSARGHQLKELIMSAVPAVSIATCSISDGDVFSEKSSMRNRTEGLSPIYEITETSLDEEEQNEDEEDEQCNASVTKEAYLDHRSNFSCSGHEEDGEL